MDLYLAVSLELLAIMLHHLKNKWKKRAQLKTFAEGHGQSMNKCHAHHGSEWEDSILLQYPFSPNQSII